ncbi:MAG: ABC transporter substrate-binding protein [archaeon]
MKGKSGKLLLVSLVLLLIGATSVQAVNYIQAPPLSQVINVPVGSVKSGADEVLFIITWGADTVPIYANGNAAVTASGSIFAQKKLRFKIVREDDFKKQVEMFIKGETPFLRCTVGMLNQAVEVLNRDSRTKPVVFYQLSWSGGDVAGDCLVVKEGINSVKDLKGKTVVLQAYGPHLDYLTTLLKDGGLKLKDVNIKYTKDLTGTENCPAEALLKEKGIDAVFVISADAMKLTSGGKVGKGGEGSVKGAKILLSTKTGKRIIPDVYISRSDYFEANRSKVESITHGLLLAEQGLRELFKNKDSQKAEYKKMATASAKMLFDSEQAVGDVEGAYGDCETTGFAGNVKFFTDDKWPRNFNAMNEEIQTAYIGINLISKKFPVAGAKWDYNQLKAGLTGIEDVVVPRFVQKEVARVVEQKRATGALETGALFTFEVYFKPNQKSFSADMYGEKFDEAIKKATTYTGAVITVEGHSDTLGYLKKKKEGAPEVVLVQQKQAAKNLSVQRAIEVRDSLIQYAKSRGISLDSSQFSVVGHGILQPRTGMCGADPCPPKTEQEWLSNMRVVFQLFNVEAEENVFRPL